MRATILAVLMLAIQATGVWAQAAPSPSELSDEALATALLQIAASSHTRIGFESVEYIRSEVVRNHPGQEDDTPAAGNAEVDQALEALIAAHPRYEWRRDGQFVVVRPTEAWTDVNDPLNRPVHNFKVERTNECEVLIGLRELILTGRYDPRRCNGFPVAFAVQSGTLVDVLNKMTESAGLLFLWQATYRPQPQPESREDWDLQLMALQKWGLRAEVYPKVRRSLQ
jgi:hypothetical protein